MMNLVRLALSNPVEALLAILCGGVLLNHVGLQQVKEVQAINLVYATEQQKTNTMVLRHNELLIRIDENVKYLKERVPNVLDN